MFINLNSCSELNTFYSNGGLLSKNIKAQETEYHTIQILKNLMYPKFKIFLEDLPPLFSIFGDYNVSKSVIFLAFKK